MNATWRPSGEKAGAVCAAAVAASAAGFAPGRGSIRKMSLFSFASGSSV